MPYFLSNPRTASGNRVKFSFQEVSNTKSSTGPQVWGSDVPSFRKPVLTLGLGQVLALTRSHRPLDSSIPALPTLGSPCWAGPRLTVPLDCKPQGRHSCR